MTDQVARQPWWKQLRSSTTSSRTKAGKPAPGLRAESEVWRRLPEPAQASVAGDNGSPSFAMSEETENASTRQFDRAAADPLQPWNQDLLEKLARAYDLGGPLEWAGPSVDRDQTAHRLRAGETEYLLRPIGANDAGALALAAEIDLIRFLAEQYFPVALVVKTRAGADYLRTRAAFYMITTTESASAFDRSNQTHRIEAAAGLAQFHQLMRDYRGALPLGPSQFLTDSLQDDAGWIEAHAGEFDAPVFQRWTFLAESLQGARAELLALADGITAVYADEPKILVHGAYDQSAVTFDGLGLAEVGNFGRLGYDTRLADLSHSIIAFCSMRAGPAKGSDDLDPVWFREFLSTYEQESPLSDREARALPLFIRAQHLRAIVEDCRRLLQASAGGPSEHVAIDLEADAICLSLRLGRVIRPPPATE